MLLTDQLPRLSHALLLQARLLLLLLFLLPVCSVLTLKFSLDSKIQFQQLNSVSTVKFRDERLMYFTSSTLWLCILRHVLEMLLEFHSG